MPVLLLPVLVALVGFMVYRKVSEKKAAAVRTGAAVSATPAPLPPPRKFVL